MSRLEFSVVIPAYNEERRLAESLRRIVEFLEPRDVPFEILVVDDGSSDATAGIAEGFGREVAGGLCRLRLLSNPRNRGKGFSVRRGMLEAQGRFGLLSDADLSTPIEELPKLEAAIREGVQVAFGSRDLQGAQVEIRQSRFRETGGKLFNRLVRLLSGLPYADTQCGFKLFDLDRTRSVFQKQRIEGFGFDVEILYLARRHELRLREVPVVWRNAEGSTVGLRSGLRAVLELFQIRRNERAGRYGD